MSSKGRRSRYVKQHKAIDQPVNMQVVRRSAQSSLRASRSAVRSQQKRFESHGSDHGHAQTSHPPTSPNQSLGLSFYAVLAAVPAIYVLHNAATAKDPYLTRVIRKYSDLQDEWLRRNDLHNAAVQRAADDRVLFLNSQQQIGHERRLSNPEALNNGSAHNVWAGAYINIDKVVDHYEKINFEENERKLQALQERQQRNE